MGRSRYGNNGMQTVARTILSGGESFLVQEPKGTLVYTVVYPVAALEVIDGEGVDRSETTFSLQARSMVCGWYVSHWGCGTRREG